MIDDADFELVSSIKWQCHPNGYVCCRTKVWDELTGGMVYKYILMHRLIMKAPKGKEIDHIDGDGLNNQRDNLRFCERGENVCNTGLRKDNISGIKGVTWNKDTNKWAACINHEKKRYYLGVFQDIQDAARTYRVASRLLHGKYSFPDTRDGAARPDPNDEGPRILFVGGPE